MTRTKYAAGFALSLLAALLVTSCATRSFPAGEECSSGSFAVRDGFAGARRGTCTVESMNHVSLDILSEPSEDGKRVNDSAWYGFRLIPEAPGEALVTLQYTGGHHRYPPKISEDGLTWYPLDEQHVAVSPDRLQADITIPLGDKPLWVAAQEIIPPSFYSVWQKKITRGSDISLSVLGRSKAGLPIHLLDSSPSGKDVLFLIGRQHPPEVSGAFAFFAFAETVFGDSELAQQFRDRFRVIAIPILNPDGVTGGNWRLNLGGVDLNRDWGRFKEPETALVGDLLESLDKEGAHLRMFIDFHSTGNNVFYTQERTTQPPGFTAGWLSSMEGKLPDYPFRNIPGPGENKRIAKNYIFDRYGIPAITYEVGDETDREATRFAARRFAEELMRRMLAQEY